MNTLVELIFYSCWINRNIAFVYSHECQTHSLSMEKQVTGPSAVQVAVLKTSLQEEKKTLHMSTQEMTSVNTCVSMNIISVRNLRKLCINT